jgi:hypothetical protein
MNTRRNRVINRLLNNIYLQIKGFLSPEISNFKFALGQSAILASRQSYSKVKNLWDAEVKVYSQWGEDGILDYICEIIELTKPRVLEIGAGNFLECNSRFIAEFRNASVVAVDARADLLNTPLHSLKWKNHIELVNEWITPDNIDSIIKLAEHNMNSVDIFSLDLDGNDYWILENANLSQFKIVVVEYNALFGSSYEVTVPRNDRFERHKEHASGLYYGASLKAFVELLKLKGFIFIGTNRSCLNAFFIKKNLRSKFKTLKVKDLDQYVDSTIRESRDSFGKLSFLAGIDRNIVIESLPLWNVASQQMVKVRDVFLL